MGSLDPLSKLPHSSTVPPSALPTATSTAPFWRTDLHELDNHRTTDELPATCDILIIGGGYAGISAAYHLLASDEAKAKAGANGAGDANEIRESVVLLEARGACSGATARNGGHLRPFVYPQMAMLVKEYGREMAEELCAFEHNHVSAIAALIKKEGIECDLKLSRSHDIYTDREQAQKAKETYLKLKESGVAGQTIEDLIWTDEEDAERVSGVKGCVGCFTFTAGSLWPYKLMMALLSRAHATGGLNLQTHTPVHSISQSANGSWTATTDRGTITAAKVLLATNAYTSALLPEYAGKIVGCRGICCHIVPDPSRTAPPPMPYSYGLRLPRGSHDYMISRPDGSVIVGGGRSEFLLKRETWYNNTDDSTLIEPAKNYFDNYMQTHFIGWEDTGAKVKSIWTGVMGFSSDGLPSVGPVPGKKGLWLAAGFVGHGMPVIWLTTKGVVKLLEGKEWKESGIPRAYETTKARLDNPRDNYNPKV